MENQDYEKIQGAGEWFTLYSFLTEYTCMIYRFLSATDKMLENQSIFPFFFFPSFISPPMYRIHEYIYTVKELVLVCTCNQNT